MEKKTRKTGNRNRVIASAGLLALCGIAFLLAKKFPEGVTAYFTPFSRFFGGVWGKLFSIFPFSVSEFGLYALILGFLLSLVWLVVRLLCRGGLQVLFSFTSYWLLILSSLFSFFLLTWGLNNFGVPISQRLGLEVRPYAIGELYDATKYYIEQTNAYAAQVHRDEAGLAQLGDFHFLGQLSVQAVDALGDLYPELNGPVSPPKAVTWSDLMNYTSITGIYLPFSGECNVNPDGPSLTLPFTMTHELSHRLGVAREDEANYTAFLACATLESPEARYSGYYYAFLYCYNAITRQDGARQAELYAMLSPEVLRDVAAIQTHYAQYEGKLNDWSTSLNDNYLKAMNQEAGVQSYGNVTDLLIAHYLDIAA